MASLSSSDDDDFPTQPCRSYSVSADVSDSDTSSSFSCCRLHSDLGGASSSPFIAGIAMPSPLVLPVIDGEDGFVWDGKDQKEETDSSEVDMMMERFSKLLLGEDMSGGGKGVCTALAISNAITNLAATVFGELWRLEPLAPQKKKMWCREMEWLLCVSDSIVELVPSVQPFPSGGMFEVMALRPRLDLYMNLPALKKLDAMLLGMLDGFKDTEFWYVDRGISIPEPEEHDMHQPGMCVGRPSEDKWWLPSPKVPPNGLSEEGRKRLHRCRDCTNQILKAAMAINSSVLAEMEVPSAYLETLPTKGRDGLGETIYRYITADQFSPDCLLDRLNLSSEHRTREVVNRVEATVHLWKQKGQRKRASHSKTKRSSWGGKVKGLVTGNEKYQALARRAETLLRSLKLRFPSLPQTALDMSKIQYNKDVGQAILESYSRVIESLAFNIMARIDDLLSADDAAKQTALAQANSIFNRAGFTGLQKRISPSPFSIHHTPNFGSPFATPSFSSTPPGLSPLRSLSSMSKSAVQAAEDSRLEKSTVVEFERIWSCPRNLSVRKSYRDTPERD